PTCWPSAGTGPDLRDRLAALRGWVFPRGAVTAANPTIDAIWRIESPRIVGGLARLVRDVGLAEELAQDALVEALETWPVAGVPANPGAWLMLVAKRRALDRFRRQRMMREKN